MEKQTHRGDFEPDLFLDCDRSRLFQIIETWSGANCPGYLVWVECRIQIVIIDAEGLKDLRHLFLVWCGEDGNAPDVAGQAHDIVLSDTEACLHVSPPSLDVLRQSCPTRGADPTPPDARQNRQCPSALCESLGPRREDRQN